MRCRGWSRGSAFRGVKLALVAAALLAAGERMGRAFSSGPPPAHTGAPSESNCTACHSSFELNSGPGSVSLGGLPANYTPGQSYPLTLTTAHPDGFLYGFQLTALGAGGTPAGTLIVSDATNTQLIAGSAGGQIRSYLEHTHAGAFPVEFDRRVWSFNWMAPGTDVGPVTFYFAGNGADGNSETSGDYIYTAQRQLGCTGATPASQSFTAAGGSSSFALTSACNWTATTSDDWIQITSPAAGSGNGSVAFTVAPNLSTSARAGSITIGGIAWPVLQGANFLDVAPTDDFYTEIGKISARGVTVGCGGGNYCPNDPVTREQMAAFIIRALGEFNPPAPAFQQFADVPPSNFFYAFIDRMAVRGITTGCPAPNYCPGEPVTREQMAAFIIRALGVFNPPMPPAQRFLDVPPNNFFYAFIEEMAVRGITTGCPAPNYCPGELVTRGQMAAFLRRAFNL